MEESEVKLRERVTKIEADLENEIAQREKLGQLVDDMRDIVIEIKHMREDLKAINDKVNTLEEKPAKRWESIIAGIIGAIAGGIGAAFISFITGG